MKQRLEYIFITLLFVVSFVYTNKIANVVKNKDPIMQMILSNTSDYELASVNAVIESNTIIPGVTGCVIDVDKSYENMKRINEYTEKMLKYRDLVPEITLNNIFDKYIAKSNGIKRNVAIVVNIKDSMEYVNSIVNNNEFKLNIFLDSELLEDGLIEVNKEYINVYNGGVNNNYDDITIEWMNDVIEDNYNDSKYCINKNRNDDNLLVCARNRMHTISPNLVVTSSNLYNIKSNISNGSIIYFDENALDNILSIVNFVKSKGYEIVYLNELLNEKICE